MYHSRGSVAAWSPRILQICHVRWPKKGVLWVWGLVLILIMLSRRGVAPGEGAVREVAAFLLDHGHFSGVPPTALVSCHEMSTLANPEVPLAAKIGSLQVLPSLHISHFAEEVIQPQARSHPQNSRGRLIVNIKLLSAK